MELVYTDADVVVCVKPPRVLSTDEPGGVPELVRQALGNPSADIRTVHRLDRVVGGLMVLARNPAAASDLSRQIREGRFEKNYLAVLHGAPEGEKGTLRDLLGRDKARKMTYIASAPGKGIQEAVLEYHVLNRQDGMSRVHVCLFTGRTHQIRAQFSSRGMPLLGDRKYGAAETGFEGIALWSHRLEFTHPQTEERAAFTAFPPPAEPWTLFGDILHA